MYPFMEMPLGVTEREISNLPVQYHLSLSSLITSGLRDHPRVLAGRARALRTRHAPGFSDVYITITKD